MNLLLLWHSSVRFSLSPESRPFITPAALRSAFIDIHRGTARSRYDLELFDLSNPLRDILLALYPLLRHLRRFLLRLYLSSHPHIFLMNPVIPTFLFALEFPKIQWSIG